MKRLILSIIGTLSLLSAPAAFAMRISELDRPINLTARVLDGSIVQSVEKTYPTIGPNGTVYVVEKVKRERSKNLTAHRTHCRIHQESLKKDAAGCGKGFTR